MKAINPDKARYIAQDFHGGQHSELYSFGSTGQLLEEKKGQYFKEVNEVLQNPSKFLKKDVERMQLLFNYLVKYFKEKPKREQPIVYYLSPENVDDPRVLYTDGELDNDKIKGHPEAEQIPLKTFIRRLNHEFISDQGYFALD